jgi:hypothetical protein
MGSGAEDMGSGFAEAGSGPVEMGSSSEKDEGHMGSGSGEPASSPPPSPPQPSRPPPLVNTALVVEAPATLVAARSERIEVSPPVHVLARASPDHHNFLSSYIACRGVLDPMLRFPDYHLYLPLALQRALI